MHAWSNHASTHTARFEAVTANHSLVMDFTFSSHRHTGGTNSSIPLSSGKLFSYLPSVAAGDTVGFVVGIGESDVLRAASGN